MDEKILYSVRRLLQKPSFNWVMGFILAVAWAWLDPKENTFFEVSVQFMLITILLLISNHYEEEYEKQKREIKP